MRKVNQTHVRTSAQSEICQIESPLRQRLPFPAVRQDTLHVVGVCVNRIGTDHSCSAYSEGGHTPQEQWSPVRSDRSTCTKLLRYAEESNYEAYQRLVEGKPPVAGLLEDALLSVFPPGYIKPKPIRSQRWFKARTELVAMAEDYTRAVAAAGGGGGGGIPREVIAAAGGSDNWRGKYSAIDTDRAVIAIDDSKNERVLVFPIVIKSETDSQSRTVWVRARLGRSKPGPLKSESSISKEDLLMKAIERVQGQGKKPKPTPTIKPNRQTIAMLGTARIDVVSSRAEAMKGLRDI